MSEFSEYYQDTVRLRANSYLERQHPEAFTDPVRMRLLDLQQEFAAYKSDVDYAKLHLNEFCFEHTGEGDVCFLQHDENEASVVRLLESDEISYDYVRESAYDRMLALTLGEGVPYLEQPKAFELGEGTIITKPAPGVRADKADNELFRIIADEQLDTTYNVLLVAREQGLAIDPHATNMFCDRDAESLFFIDYMVTEETDIALARSDLMEVVKNLASQADPRVARQLFNNAHRTVSRYSLGRIT